MRSESIRVKRPSWVRIVNPDPIRILDMSWSYGDYVRIEPGGSFRTMFQAPPRTLAMYQPPYGPSETDDAPPNAMVLYTPDELRLLAEGKLSFNEPFERPVPRCGLDRLAEVVRVGDRAAVPFSRTVRASPPRAAERYIGSPYRGERVVRVRTSNQTIRPGGVMTVISPDGNEPRTLLHVQYQANPAYRGDQCPSGHRFEIPESEFLRMREANGHLKGAEALERALIARLLRSP